MEPLKSGVKLKLGASTRSYEALELWNSDHFFGGIRSDFPKAILNYHLYDFMCIKGAMTLTL